MHALFVIHTCISNYDCFNALRQSTLEPCICQFIIGKLSHEFHSPTLFNQDQLTFFLVDAFSPSRITFYACLFQVTKYTILQVLEVSQDICIM